MHTSLDASIWIALVLAVFLALLHLAAPRIRKLPFVPESATGSFAGGLAVAYVFLHLLPDLAAGNESIGAALRRVLRPSPLIDLGIFLVALVGFTAFYGLERLAQRSSGQPESQRRSIFQLHLASFMVYNGLITYTMPLRVRTGVAFAVLFAIAMALHFVLTDRSMSEHYGSLFSRGPRLVLAGALLAGWLLATVFAPSSALLVDLLTALLAGSILLNVFKDEVPSNSGSSFPWFVSGLTLYAAVLAAVTAMAQ